MDPYIILAKTEQGAWIETKEIGTSQWSKQQQLILAQGEDSKKGQLIYLMWKGSFQVNLYKMIRFLSGKLKKHTKLAKIVKKEIFNRLVFPLNFNRFCHPMTLYHTSFLCYLQTNQKCHEHKEVKPNANETGNPSDVTCKVRCAWAKWPNNKRTVQNQL